jgi:hypothetical protein
MYGEIWYRDLKGRTFDIVEDGAEQNVEIVEMLREDLNKERHRCASMLMGESKKVTPRLWCRSVTSELTSVVKLFK